jgi:sulfite reductase beta subunit-like hemoprotein
VFRLHAAADGWLARIRVPGGRLPPQALAAIAAAAEGGNGTVELTSRASVQVRGLAADSGPALALGLAAGGLMPSPAHDLIRNILASPLAGRDPRSLAQTDDVVAALDRGLCSEERFVTLSGRFSFAVGDGGPALRSHRADIALQACGPDLFRLHLGGIQTALATTRADAAALALSAARGFIELRDQDGGVAWGLAQLTDGPARLAAWLGTRLREQLPAAPAPVQLGTCVQRDGRVAVTALVPLGRMDAATVWALCGLQREVRISAHRTLTLLDLAPGEDADALAAQLRGMGLITAAHSGWRGLTACAGTGACAKARVDVRAAAAERAARRDGIAWSEHWAACERGCGKPADVRALVTAGDAGLQVDFAGETRTAGDVDGALMLLAGAGSR